MNGISPDVALTLFGSCIAAGLLIGAVIALVNSWRV